MLKHCASPKLLILLTCLLMIPMAGLRASERLEFVATKFPLILDQAADGKAAGLAIDVLDRIAGRIGFEYTVNILPFPRLMYVVRNHQADGAVGLYRNDERRKYLRYAKHAFYEDLLMVATRPGALPAWNGDLASLQEQNLLMIASWAYGKEFERQRMILKLQPINTVDQALNMVLAERAGGALINQRSVEAFRRKNPQAGSIELLSPAFGHHRGYFTLDRSRVSRQFFDRFDAAMTELVRSGFVQDRNRALGLDYHLDHSGQ